ncbi:iron complex transport system substrate-binding protein [Terribacillus halophilus]|uniref:Iron complex transport system substrate-binding protein n=1 Tax=Terribacillus halophilus TaxID=361279 RepID=A0A1G6LCF8_9BACI|nr:iron-hydroxamate ABC transporter substrate-binding protein [Terribacillus halophilus]SDC40969.1 iron complex transport system substrate-binding protein [Terribacillus halophilus]
MKKLFPILFILLLVLAACGSNDSDGKASSSDNGNETITYESEDGPVKVPADPQRVVVLSSYAGDLIDLDIPIVGADAWSMQNPRFKDSLKDAEEVTEDDLEKIIELKPDLIIGLSGLKNLDKLKEIAPTVTFTYGKLNYLDQHVEIGKLVNKEDDAQNWVDDFTKRAADAGEQIKEKIGADATVSVVENFDKQLYIYGDNWGRGTEVLYQAMGLNMPQKVKEDALEAGYLALSTEVLPEYMGDYVILSKFDDTDTSVEESESFQNTDAAKNNQVYVVDGDAFYFNDSNTLDYQLEFIKESFLGN